MDPYVGEIRLFAGDYAPYGWALCNGQTLLIQQNSVLFSIIGAQYGGDGKTTFALPNLQGNAAIGQGTGPGLTPRPFASSVGSSTVTLLENEIPAHTHIPNGTAITAGGVSDPSNNIWASETASFPFKPYSSTPNTPMNAAALSSVGGSQQHNNMQPYLALNFIIALEGVYPPKQ